MKTLLQSEKLNSGSTISLYEWNVGKNTFWRIEWENEHQRSSVPYTELIQAKSTYENILKF